MAVTKFLRIIAYIIVSLTLLIITAVVAIWFNLGWILNESNIEKYKSRFLPQGAELTWENLNLDVKSRSWTKRDVLIDAAGLCFSWKADTTVEACFDRIRVDIGARLLPRPQLLVVREIQVSDREIKIQLSSTKQQDSEPRTYDRLYAQAFDYWIMAEEIINDYEFNKVNLEVDNFTLHSGEQKFALNLISKFQSPQERLPFEVRIKSDDQKLDLNLNATVEIAAKGGLRSTLRGDANVQLEGRIFSLDLRLKKKLYTRQAQLDIQPTLKKPTHTIFTLQLSSLLTEDNIHVQVDSGNIYLPQPLTMLELQNCRADIEVNEALQSEVTCKPLARWEWTPKLSKRIKAICNCDPPDFLQLSTTARGPLMFFIDPQFDGIFTVEVKVPDYSFKFLNFDVDGDIEVFRNENDELAFTPDLKARLGIKKFEALVEMLQGSPLAIPAPFHVLNGPASLNFATDTNLETETHFGAKLTFDSKLKSPTQEVSVKSDLEARVAKNFKPPFEVTGDIILRSVLLELPPFYPISGVPHVFKSQKIKKEVNAKADPDEKPATVNYDLKIRTQSKNAVKLRWNLVDPFIPVTLNFSLKGQQTNGELNLDRFTLETFNRETIIESLKLSLPRGENETPAINADLRVDQGGYAIFINVIGKVDDVQIYMRSNPPLPRNDIISVLIYGRTFDTLAGTERDNVGNTGAAIADKAIGLFGIWLFASTPIQSVSYNPATKNYSAQVQVSDSTVLSVGTDWERVQNLELRRHLKGNWMVVTSYEPGEEEAGKGSLMLQWQKFY